MQVVCPECRGARRMRYILPQSEPRITEIMSAEAMAQATYEARDEDCRTCNGVGRVISTARVPVFQDGERIGTLPHDFDPCRIKSRSWLYEPRKGDFRLDDGAWIAARTLGPGDLEAVPGFVWDRR